MAQGINVTKFKERNKKIDWLKYFQVEDTAEDAEEKKGTSERNPKMMLARTVWVKHGPVKLNVEEEGKTNEAKEM